ncbi:Rha family transcriptional regulator [Aerococcus viridans]|uniref:Rha family transcriptional regulator n=1 Tax=Aerococcus viridans TaxID=1377 RepID=UPI002DBB5E21|nr:Rha family transcriptional regulator [Aerococcus viridans]MEB7388731.1 Rha family transcriptional regulator [Aerococcus viridans]
MENLVIMKDKQAVTASLQVAENFGKRHDHILRDLDELKEGLTQNWGDLFSESTYVHPQNKQEYRMIYMNRDGFTLLAMGFTGKKALQFKMAYINAFNEMENYIQQRQLPMSQEDIMIATLETQKELKKQISTVSSDVEGLKQEIDLSRLQKSKLSKLVRKNAMEAVGGKHSQAYEGFYKKAISEHWREIKNYFDVASYEEIPKLRFDEAMELAAMWKPSMELAFEIKKSNSQTTLGV